MTRNSKKAPIPPEKALLRSVVYDALRQDSALYIARKTAVGLRPKNLNNY